jgi:transcription factor C subunit 6
MTRSLRPAKARPSYSTSLGHDDDLDAVAGPSNQTAVEEDSDDNDGSDFAPEDAQFRSPHSSTPQGDIGISSTDGGVSQAVLSKRSIKAKGKGKSNVDSAKPPLETASISTPQRLSNRQMYALPTPSVHHRHRAVALFTHAKRVERLDDPPSLFGPAKTTFTNNFTYNTTVTDRVNKAWGYNVGSGPLWELLEDRSRYKEAVSEEGDVEQEIYRRPLVHENVTVRAGWSILNAKSVFFPFNNKS